MTRAEKLLYHQLHPAKLLTDLTTSFASTSLLWQHAWIAALVVAWIPSIVVTAVLVGAVDLDRYRDTPIGRYVRGHLDSRRITVVRFGGQAVMWAGAIAQIVWLIPLGFMVIVYAWLSGLWARQAGAQA